MLVSGLQAPYRWSRWRWRCHEHGRCRPYIGGFPGGPRYDPDMASEVRSDISNGIWLCQTHAKLIDDDEFTYTPAVLRDWKETAEHMAALEAKGFAIRRASPFPDIEKKVPKLVAEMREDLRGQPLVRKFILLSRKVSYNGSEVPYFVYYLEDHEYLQSIMTIMEHSKAIYDVAFNRVPRYHFPEEFVAYLIGPDA